MTLPLTPQPPAPPDPTHEPAAVHLTGRHTAWIVIGSLLAVIIVGCLAYNIIPAYRQSAAPTLTCRDQARSYITAIQPLLDDWDAAHKLAASTPRIALPSVIRSMQSLRSSIAAESPPSCLAAAHAELLNYIDYTLDAYIGFLGQDEELIVNENFRQANEAFDAYTTALKTALNP